MATDDQLYGWMVRKGVKEGVNFRSWDAEDEADAGHCEDLRQGLRRLCEKSHWWLWLILDLLPFFIPQVTSRVELRCGLRIDTVEIIVPSLSHIVQFPDVERSEHNSKFPIESDIVQFLS